MLRLCAYVLFFKCMSSRAKIIYITICLCRGHLFLIPKQSGFAKMNRVHATAMGNLGQNWRNVAGLADDSDQIKTSSPRQNQTESRRFKMCFECARNKVVYLSSGSVDY